MAFLYLVVTLLVVVPFAMLFSLGISNSYRKLGLMGRQWEDNDMLVYHWDSLTGESRSAVL